MGQTLSRLSRIIIASLEKLYRFLPHKWTSRLFFALGYLILRKSPLFDGKYYLASNPDVAALEMSPLLHYLRCGAAEGRNPNPWFDTNFYVSTHPGTASTGINPLFYYIIVGASHKTRPHPLFDTAYYLTENQDVATSGMNPLAHFIVRGLKEGRIPDPLLKENESNCAEKELFALNSPRNSKTLRKNPAEDLRVGLLTKRTLWLFEPSKEQVIWMSSAAETMRFRPEVTIVIFQTDNDSDLSNSLNSVFSQAYPYYSVVVISDRKRGLYDQKVSFLTNCDIIKSTDWLRGSFAAFLRAGNCLLPNALFELVERVNVDPSLHLICCDEYLKSPGGQGEFFFKPDWSPDLLLSSNYIGDFFLIRKDLFNTLGGLRKDPSEAGLFDLLLRVSETSSNICRVGIPLVQKSVRNDGRSRFEEEPLRTAITRRGQEGNVIGLQIPANYRVKLSVQGAPLVSIIIPTAFSSPEENLGPCLHTIARKTSYDNYEIILIDNSKGKLKPDWLREMGHAPTSIRIVNHDRPFNYSQIMNRGSHEARGEYLLMLNDDIEVVSPGWIEAMLEHAQQNGVGVVGAKLLYPRGRVQHAGGFVVDGQGQTRHVFQYLDDDPSSYHGLGSVVRNCSFVTFAAAMVNKNLFLELGGLDERFDVEYNDSDFCLRAFKVGYRVVYTPHSVLIHKDARTRSSVKMVKIARNIELFHDKWRDIIEGGDPYYT